MSIFSIFTLLGGLAFFIYGMNQMSHSLERIAGNKMEQFIKKIIYSLKKCIIDSGKNTWFNNERNNNVKSKIKNIN